MLAMRRSGHHVVVHQVCHHLGRVLHLNNCKTTLFSGIVPIKGRFRLYDHRGIVDSGVLPRRRFRRMLATTDFSPNVLYSFEDADVGFDHSAAVEPHLDLTTICVVRDPFNWLASSLQHGSYMARDLDRRIERWKKQVVQCLRPESYPFGRFVDVNYNRWVSDRTYREDLSRRLGLPFSDLGIEEVLEFGPGSSFEGTSFDGRGSKMAVLERYKRFEDDARYRLLVDDRELVALSEAYFGFTPESDHRPTADS